MFFHMRFQAVNVFEISHMAELIQFVITDCLNGHLFLDIGKVFCGSGHRSDTGTRETYF